MTKHELDSEDLLFIEHGLALLVSSGFRPGDVMRQRFLLQRLQFEAMRQDRETNPPYPALIEEAIK